MSLEDYSSEWSCLPFFPFKEREKYIVKILSFIVVSPVIAPCRSRLISNPGKQVVLILAEASCFGLSLCSLTLGVTLTTTGVHGPQHSWGKTDKSLSLVLNYYLKFALAGTLWQNWQFWNFITLISISFSFQFPFHCETGTSTLSITNVIGSLSPKNWAEKERENKRGTLEEERTSLTRTSCMEGCTKANNLKILSPILRCPS